MLGFQVPSPLTYNYCRDGLNLQTGCYGAGLLFNLLPRVMAMEGYSTWVLGRAHRLFESNLLHIEFGEEPCAVIPIAARLWSLDSARASRHAECVPPVWLESLARRDLTLATI